MGAHLAGDLVRKDEWGKRWGIIGRVAYRVRDALLRLAFEGKIAYYFIKGQSGLEVQTRRKILFKI